MKAHYECSSCGKYFVDDNASDEVSSYSLSIKSTGHDLKLTSSTPATCTATGSKIYKCSICGAVDTETINSLGHSYYNAGSIGVENTWKCANGHTFTEPKTVLKNVIHNGSSSFVYVGVCPYCQSGSYTSISKKTTYKYQCSRCGATKTVTS